MLATFIKAAQPGLTAAVTLTEITDPVRLRKKSGADLTAAASTLVRKARGKARKKAGKFLGIAVHEDMDTCVGPEYSSARQAVSAALAKESETASASSVYALAAAESEAWLLLFPSAFALYRPSWKIPERWQGKDTGRRQNPKRDLEVELSSPRFRESDGPEIVARALTQGVLSTPVGSNRSYSDFIKDLALMTTHVQSGR